MPRPPARHPTELELEILKVLWNRGPSTVRQIQEALAPERSLAYTTVMTMLTIMLNKQYVERERQGAGYLYSAAVEQQQASTGMLQDLVERVFDGSVAAVVEHLLETSDLDADELQKIRALISRKRQERNE